MVEFVLPIVGEMPRSLFIRCEGNAVWRSRNRRCSKEGQRNC